MDGCLGDRRETRGEYIVNREAQFHSGSAQSAPPAIDIVADDADQLTRIARWAERLGIDVADRFVWRDITVDRLGSRPVWIELEDDAGTALDHWLMAFDARSDSAEIPSTIVMTEELVDPVTALLGSQVDLVVAPDAATRAGAISMLAARASAGDGVAEAKGSDPEALRRLSEEVQRIAAALSALSDDGYDATPPVVTSTVAPSETLSVETVRALIRARRLREDFFDKDLFHDPAWDMMLDLLAAEIAQHRVPVSSLCMAAAVPPTTALRWIKTMVDKELLVRRSDPHDGRRIFVELSPPASRGMRSYFSALGDRTAA